MFPNLFNEWYPRQTNRKINAVIQHKAEKGADCFHSTLWLSERPHGQFQNHLKRGGKGAAYLPPVRFRHGAGADCPRRSNLAS